MKAQTIGRNDPCPCGSAKKYKQCCLLTSPRTSQENASIDDIMECTLRLCDTAIKKKNYTQAEHYAFMVLQDNPFDDRALCLLARVAAHHGQYDAAVMLLERAIKHNGSQAIYYYDLGVALARQSKFTEAIPAFTTAVTKKNHLTQGWRYLGICYSQLKQWDQAKEALEHALALDPDSSSTQYLLATLSHQAADSAPHTYIADLFNEYAGNFDYHLQQVLGYQTPSKIAEYMTSFLASYTSPHEELKILDLGCGTGLGAQALQEKGIQGAFCGVDLSENMIQQARSKNIYRKLHLNDIESFLLKHRKIYDIILASDVFVYIGKLDTIMERAKALLVPHGFFAFSVEKEDSGQTYTLKRSGRYGHNATYLKKILTDHHFTLLTMETVALRKENDTEIQGYVMIAQKKP